MTRRYITPRLIQVLQLLAEHPDGISGYDIQRKTKIAGPTVYKMLGWLVDEYWASARSVPSEFRGSPPRKLVVLTDDGHRKAAEISTRAEYANRHVTPQVK